jgi:hypothetical protein
MGSLQSDIPNSQPISKGIQEEAHFEDEINLIDYFRVVWKRKFFILLCSVLPALIVGLILLLGPRDYKVTYIYDVKDQSVYDVRDRSVYDVRDRSVYDVRDHSVYDVKDRSIHGVSNWNLNEKNYTMLLDSFYSAENTGKIVSKLRENGLDRYAKLISRAQKEEELKKFIDFEVLPSYVNLSKARITDPAMLEQIGQLRAHLLNMTIVARPKSDIPKISLVIRDNIENVVPLYSIEQGLIETIRGYRAQMADIEENKFGLEIELEGEKATLAKLKTVKTGASDKAEGNVILQFDLGDRSEYLPLGYQTQAAESKILELEENINVNEQRYEYYKSLLGLNRKLFAELKRNVASYYTIQQFHSFLTGVVKDSKDKELIDYLSAYIKKIENRISASAPITESPRIYAVARGTVKKTAVVFAVLLMVTTFVAFLLEAVRKDRVQTP